MKLKKSVSHSPEVTAATVSISEKAPPCTLTDPNHSSGTTTAASSISTTSPTKSSPTKGTAAVAEGRPPTSPKSIFKRGDGKGKDESHPCITTATPKRLVSYGKETNTTYKAATNTMTETTAVTCNLPSDANERRNRRAARRQLYNEARIIVPLLASRKYHLPGNNYCQDWIEFVRNNHPLFGIFCHHRLHPLRWGQRIIFLLGSIAFGLAVTSFVTLYYAYVHKDMNDILLCIKLQQLDLSTSTSGQNQCKLRITYGMLTLWTLGSGLHSVFDVSLWYISACCCFLPGGMFERYHRIQKIGSYLVLVIVAVMMAIATFSVILRGRYESRKKQMEEGLDDVIANTFPYDTQSFSFVIGYLIEQALVWFVYYFLIASVLFSGILGCGCVPVLGGRPQEMNEEMKEREKEMLKLQHSLSMSLQNSASHSHDLEEQSIVLGATSRKNTTGSPSTMHSDDDLTRPVRLEKSYSGSLEVVHLGDVGKYSI